MREAVEQGDAEAIKTMAGWGWDVDGRSDGGEAPLLKAAEFGCVEALRALLEAGADIEAKSCEGSAALITAASHGHREAMRLLLALGAGVDGVDAKGSTALNVAARVWDVEAMRVLMDAGADMDFAWSKGRTALGCAMELIGLATPDGLGECKKCIEALLSAGALLENVDGQGNDAQTLAEIEGIQEIINLIVSWRERRELDQASGRAIRVNRSLRV